MNHQIGQILTLWLHQQPICLFILFRLRIDGPLFQEPQVIVEYVTE